MCGTNIVLPRVRYIATVKYVRSILLVSLFLRELLYKLTDLEVSSTTYKLERCREGGSIAKVRRLGIEGYVNSLVRW
jgi:hypothetical protein